MTPLLQRLESHGYITREYEIGDERQKSITLTSLGKSFDSEASKVAQQALCATGLSEKEVKQLILLCQKVK